jgi:ABC-type spermidine/putrescine transport system permease subunit II
MTAKTIQGKDAARAKAGSQVWLDPFNGGMRLVTVIVVILLVAPLVVIVGASLTQGNFMAFPPEGLGWRWYAKLFHNSDWLDAIRTSLIVATCSSMLATAIGATLALALARFSVRLSPALRALALLPLLFPPVVIGVAFLGFYYDIGLVGYGYVKLILSHAIFNEPFPFLLVYGALHKVNPEIEQAAMSLGATLPKVFRTVTIPLVASEIVAGLVLAFVLSLNDFIIAFLVSSFTITTLPIQIFSSLRYSYSPLIAVASSLFIVATIIGVFLFSKVARGLFD